MKYKAYVNFRVLDGEESLFRNTDIPLAHFQVQGGATRVVNFKSTDDIMLIGELKDAQQHKNIVLYLPPTKDHKDMKAAMDLTAIAKEGWDFVLSIVVERYSNGKLLEGFLLGINSAVLKTHPMIVGGNLLLVEVKFEDSKLHQGKIVNHFIPNASKAKVI